MTSALTLYSLHYDSFPQSHYTCHSLTQSVRTLSSLDSAWSVDWYTLRALRADSLKTQLATSVLLSRHVPRHHHPSISLVCWPLPQQKTVSYCCAIATIVWRHLRMRHIALRHTCMRRREGNSSIVLLRHPAVPQCLEQIHHNTLHRLR
jgi:hypothetical protein